MSKPMDTAPKDGTVIIGHYDDGTDDFIFWNTERYCMLGRRAGSYPDGWSSTSIDGNLPVDAPETWSPVKC